MIVGGIFGRKKSGKTTLAKHLGVEYWHSEDRRSLVLDPNATDNWGSNFWVTSDDALFWHTAWSTKHCLLIVDDAGKSIDRDSELTDAFTRINHNGHKLLVIGHDGVNLTRVMREQMDTLYLFAAGNKAVEKWEEVFPDPPPPKGMTKLQQIRSGQKDIPLRMEDAMYLNQYEFLYVRQYKPIEKLKLSL
jgi:hypothetical protein